MKNRELITLNRDLEYEIPSTKAPNLLKLEDILLEMEMKKSWDEAQKDTIHNFRSCNLFNIASF